MGIESLEFHEIAETNLRILNPFSQEKFDLVGELIGLDVNTNILDMACGKAEMLCQWGQRYGIRGTGIDISQVFLQAAQERIDAFGLSQQITLVQGDAGEYVDTTQSYDIVSCIGATWIGGGLIGTLKHMLQSKKPGKGYLLVGEPFWHSPPTPEMCADMEIAADDFVDLVGTMRRFESLGLRLVEMVLANQDTWDRYEASHWMAIDNYLRDNPDYPKAETLRKWMLNYQRQYLEYQREMFGWGVFVLRAD